MSGYTDGGRVAPRSDWGDVDSVPVILTRGEVWVPSAMVRHYGRRYLEKLYPNSDVHVIDPEREEE